MSKIVPAEGPLDAKIILIGESPADEEVFQGRPFVGKSGKLLDRMLLLAGIDRSSCRILNLVPVQAPKNKFALHSIEDVAMGKANLAKELSLLTNPRVYVALGANPLKWLLSIDGIGDWRGSIIPIDEFYADPNDPESYLARLDSAFVHPGLHRSTYVIPTYHPAAVLRQFEWHPYLQNDLKRAKRISESSPIRPKRTWFFNDIVAFNELASKLSSGSRTSEHSGLISIDTEQPLDGSPYVIGIATEDEVHTFEWSPAYRPGLESILASPYVLKIAHNLNHDWTFFRKRLQIEVALPYFDTMGAVHILDAGLEQSLSPGLASRFTDWPFHKWMSGSHYLYYNGLDCVVAYDAYWNVLEELNREGLYHVAEHDHRLLPPLLDMQWRGFSVDLEARSLELTRLTSIRDSMTSDLQDAVEPIVDQMLHKFEKPHLFEKLARCDCCGGGKSDRQHCWRCAGLESKPKKKADYSNLSGYDKKLKVSELKSSLPVCSKCYGSGKIRKRLPFNPNSDDQKADILYRGLGILPRRYKGIETVRVGQLEPLADKYELVKQLVDYARIDADYDTVRRLDPDKDGSLHCVFDPFGTDSGRVRSFEGLIERGTNAMNIPEDARSLIVPRPGFILLYPDMEQIEARAIAAQTQDTDLMRLFNDPSVDMHRLVRDDMRAIGLKDFSRDQAKRLEYASFYGGRAKQVAKELTDEAFRKGEGMALTEAQTEMAMTYLLSHRFSAVGDWHRSIESQLLSTRTLTSLTGRKFHFNGYIYDPKTKGVQYETLKAAYSRIPQDIGAWVLGLGLIDLWKNYWSADHHGLIHVHDALLYEVKIENLEEAKLILKKTLSRTLWGMNFPAKVQVGMTWKEASKHG